MHIQPLIGAQLGGGGERGEASPAFFENWKRCPDFRKKGPDCVHLWVKFSIENIVSRVFRRKISKMFPCRASFSCVFDVLLKHLSICPSSTTPPRPPFALKNFWLRTCTQALFFLQHAPS